MLKNKYQRSTKEARKKAKEEYFNTEEGKTLKVRTTRLLIYGILLILIAMYMIIDNFINDKLIIYYTYSVFLLIFAFIFIYGRHYVLVKNINSFMVQNKKKK